MTYYTAENITSLKRAGQLASYIAHARKVIDELEAGSIEHDQQGRDTVSFAYLWGRIGIDVETAEPYAYAYITYGDWTREFPLASFEGDQKRALAYARAALKNKLTEDAADRLQRFRDELAELEAADTEAL